MAVAGGSSSGRGHATRGRPVLRLHSLARSICRAEVVRPRGPRHGDAAHAPSFLSGQGHEASFRWLAPTCLPESWRRMVIPPMALQVHHMSTTGTAVMEANQAPRPGQMAGPCSCHAQEELDARNETLATMRTSGPAPSYGERTSQVHNSAEAARLHALADRRPRRGSWAKDHRRLFVARPTAHCDERKRKQLRSPYERSHEGWNDLPVSPAYPGYETAYGLSYRPFSISASTWCSAPLHASMVDERGAFDERIVLLAATLLKKPGASSIRRMSTPPREPIHSSCRSEGHRRMSCSRSTRPCCVHRSRESRASIGKQNESCPNPESGRPEL